MFYVLAGAQKALILTSYNECLMLPRALPVTLRGLSQLLHEKLHWFDARDRVTFNLVIMVHRCLNGWAPRYTSPFTASHCSAR